MSAVEDLSHESDIALAEMALLGTLLSENEAIDAVANIIKAEHFSVSLIGWLFEHAVIRWREGKVVDPVTMAPIAEVFAREYEDLGGFRWLMDMLDHAAPPTSAPDYARVVFDAHLRRAFVETCQDGMRLAKDSSRPAFEVVSTVRSSLEVLETSGAPEDASMIDAPTAARAAISSMAKLAQDGRPRGRMTGLRCIDRRLGGLLGGKLIVIGGRPGMGKTALLRNVLHGAAIRNPSDLFVSYGLEMGPEEMMQRDLSALSFEHSDDPVQYQNMAKGTLTPFDLQLLDEMAQRVPPNLMLDDVPTLSLDDVRRKVWALRRRGRIGAVGIDYLQLMRKPEAKGRNDAALLGEITMGLKQLARQADTCILLLSQLSRAVEQREDKKPQMADLRDSGSIEQDADVVLFPFREVYYLQRNEPKTNKAEWEMRCEELRTLMEVICAKQRQGAEGSDPQTYQAAYDHISDRI